MDSNTFDTAMTLVEEDGPPSRRKGLTVNKPGRSVTRRKFGSTKPLIGPSRQFKPKAVEIPKLATHTTSVYIASMFVIRLFGSASDSKRDRLYQDDLLQYISALSKAVKYNTTGLTDDSMVIYSTLVVLLRLKHRKPEAGKQLYEGIELFAAAYIISHEYLSAGDEEKPWQMSAWSFLTCSRWDHKTLCQRVFTMGMELDWDFGLKDHLVHFVHIIKQDFKDRYARPMDEYLFILDAHTPAPVFDMCPDQSNNFYP